MSTVRMQAFRVAVGAAFLGISTSTAHAYLDPGTGSLILQVLLGGAAGLALAGKLYWHKLLSMFRGRTGDEAVLVEKDPLDPRR